jgi:hypothetical protein
MVKERQADRDLIEIRSGSAGRTTSTTTTITTTHQRRRSGLLD